MIDSWLSDACAAAGANAMTASRAASTAVRWERLMRGRKEGPPPWRPLDVNTRGCAKVPGLPLLGGGEPLGHLRPVHRVPPRLEVVRALVLVLEVVRVLPDVVAQDRRLAVADGAVLVRRARDRQAAAVDDEPGPAGAELAHARGLELLLEVVERPERVLDRVRELAVGLAAAVGAHRLPERRVVEVAAAVVAHRAALVLRHGLEVGDDLLDRLALEVAALQGGVDLVHVGLVVL